MSEENCSKNDKKWTETRFQPPQTVTTPEDLEDVVGGEQLSLDVTKVKCSFAWMLNMTDFIKESGLKCKDCGDFDNGCHRYPDPEQRIGFCYVERKSDHEEKQSHE